jgi:hypothetical protein
MADPDEMEALRRAAEAVGEPLDMSDETLLRALRRTSVYQWARFDLACKAFGRALTEAVAATVDALNRVVRRD